MARLTLQDDVSLYRVGVAIFELAKAAYENRNPSKGLVFEETTAAPAQKAFADLFVDAYSLNSPSTKNSDSAFELRFHYDRSATDTEGRKIDIVNIVVPNMGGYEVTTSEPAGNGDLRKKFILDRFAAEALGSITIMGCGH